MPKCPVCEKETTGLLCRSCGFDGSRDYERYPSFGKIPEKTDSVRTRKAALAEKEKNTLRCPNCGGTSVSVDVESLQCTCSSCGHQFAMKKGPGPKPKPKISKLAVAALLAAVLAVGALWTNRPEAVDPPKPAESSSEENVNSSVKTNTSSVKTNASSGKTNTSIAVAPTLPPVTTTKKQEGRFPNISLGDTVQFGSYEQDNNTANGYEPIEWIVINELPEQNAAMLISKYALDIQPYHSSSEDITWEDCALREWLNGDFLYTAFSIYEQEDIFIAEISAPSNPDYIDIDPGPSTYDQIYLLSAEELLDYYPNFQDRVCTATKYAQAKGLAKCWWWLRTPGNTQIKAASVNSNGTWDEKGSDVAKSQGGIRPVLWVSTE